MTSMLKPVLTLILLTLIVWVWMHVTRIPAMQKAGIAPQDARHPGSLDGLPGSVRQVTDNYNHLLEQPAIFYALVFYIVLSGHSDPMNVMLAWLYVGLRAVHTLVQCTVNVVIVRFWVFALSTAMLMAMAGREVLTLL